MTLRVALDRAMVVQPWQTVEVGWVPVDLVRLGSHVPMAPEAVAEKHHKLVNIGPEAAPWPPLVGHWDASCFYVDDGRHEYIASLISGRTEVLCCWLTDRN